MGSINADQSFVLAAQIALANCEKLDKQKKEGEELSEKQACINNAVDITRKDAQEARKKTGAGFGTVSWNPLDLSGELINSAIQGLVYVILSGVSAAFQYIVQLSFLMIAFAAPIFLVLSLLPFQSH